MKEARNQRAETAGNGQTVDLIGFPMDLGADRRGVDMGPSALRIAGIAEKLAALGYRVRDLGDVPVEIKERQEAGDPRLKYLKEILRASVVLAERTGTSLEAGHFPLCIGGDHSMSLGSLAGIAAHCRSRRARLGVIWVDAHADMNTEETSPSGNIHGMPMAAALGKGPAALTGLLGFSPKVRPTDAVLIGMRQIDAGERELIRSLGLPVYTMTDIDRRGIADIVDNALVRLARRVDHLHVSFDLDAVDPSVVEGVGTPVPGGLSYREAHLIMETIAECGCMGSLDIAEVNPILDHRNRSAAFAVELIASAMGLRIL
jgi:arginase